jgi:hypothetical protein
MNQILDDPTESAITQAIENKLFEGVNRGWDTKSNRLDFLYYIYGADKQKILLTWTFHFDFSW